MNGAILAIDAGNTRVKWGLHDRTQWTQKSWVNTADVAQLEAALTNLPVLDAITVSNVAGSALAHALAAFLPPSPVARWIRSEQAQCGVRNGYDDSAQLGCDRWAALIGARALYAGPAIVVCAGTALTADALTDDGVFAGGIIVPGEGLMRQALAGNTDALELQPGQFSYFPGSTGDAIASGAINALCGAVERMARFLEETGQARPVCILSGGAAAVLAPHLNLEVRTVDNLVLEGLLRIACEA